MQKLIHHWFELKRCKVDEPAQFTEDARWEWRVYEKGADGYSGISGQYKDTEQGLADALEFIQANNNYETVIEYRRQALSWWNDLTTKQKSVESQKLFSWRKPETLTGREIHRLWNMSDQTPN